MGNLEAKTPCVRQKDVDGGRIVDGQWVAQAIVLSSQTDKFTWATAFSHYFGLKNCKKTKIEFLFAFFHLAQAIQSFTT